MNYKVLDYLLYDLRLLSSKYQETQKNKINSKFNLFKVISDKYHYENLHSDIIAFLLNTKASHGQGDLFFRHFIEFLKTQKPSIAGFLISEIHREKGRIDICVRDEKNKKSIIIENKINDARDQKDQLLNYYQYETNNGYKVEAIVYLSLNGEKYPPYFKETEDLVLKMAAFNGKHKGYDLYNGWLKKCISQVDDKDVSSFLSQYLALYKILSNQIMDYNILKDFFEKINESPETYETAISIGNMVNDLQQFIAQHFVNKYLAKNYLDVFKEIIYVPEDDRYWAVLQGCYVLSQNFNLTIDLEVKNPQLIEISIFERNDQVTVENQHLFQYLNSIKHHEFILKDERYRIEYKFPTEESLIDECIANIVKDLRGTKQSPAFTRL